MSMSPAIIGALVGFLLAIIDKILISVAIRQVQNPAHQAKVKKLRLVSYFSLIAFPVIGYFYGPMVVH